ncbi:MAG: hypothetical protein IGS49_18735 [Chlorogloeopsis fritschii C42_A2020_084]|jgi:hypothetical protein|uniref:hypothetical protein n=1 Tax=Chlorogloeopsis fritschii TaxID=1124 RepID=UPI001A0D0FA1|nr:hypothetical protein [Chlorogloeopsis fritschii]MBF2007438.1 hypothetical protein [Chlorogloeopsis fritschii C42_A2020_084]
MKELPPAPQQPDLSNLKQLRWQPPTLQQELLELRRIQAQLTNKKAELEIQMAQLLQKQSEVDKLIVKTHYKELDLQQQMENQARPLVEADKALQIELLSLLHGDALAAYRLLKHQQNINPGQALDWYLEKVIWDLKRDRC